MTLFCKKLSLLTIISILLASCVAKKEFDAVSLERNQLENDKTRLQEELKVANEKINRLEVQVEDLQGKNTTLKSDLDFVSEELKKVQEDYTRIKQLYDNLLTNSSQLSTDIAQQQQRLLAIEDELEIEQKRNQELAEDLSKREAKVAELERLIAEKDLAVQNLKKRVTDALLNFQENDLSVEVKNGKVYVSLAEKLLFNSGSTKVDAKGVGALKQLANALSGNKEINIMVEGHTDDVPLSGSGKFADNWDLSVIRATSIVRILIDNGIASEVITASGRGEFSPVAENTTAENKALNRRTEIILTPKLDKLFQLLETY
ncbi:OmpA family protein [Roseivirga misakiensis]|uniref:OmpA-like domain-containing protein n=1 Tax=Roseivirga misakiensis TaxID=1563681 RepID=A0A1E5T0Z0_9BACT|nr:OmpA family protein [Roseivirga misakiensis]OEK05026.1 hypothetical protein BFP71_16525 [Roseivirga misakiensis]